MHSLRTLTTRILLVTAPFAFLIVETAPRIKFT